MVSYNDIKNKCVVNVLDGRKLGKITDILFSFPEGNISAFVVGEKKLFGGEEFLINLCCVNKIGDDAILVSLSKPNEIRKETIQEDE